MGINYNFSKGNDFPVWQWLPFLPSGANYHGFDNEYDGKRYIYVAAQYGTTATSASTTALYRFDTWSHGWQYICTLTSGNRGLTLTYDSVRNVVIIAHGAALTSWQVFNLNAAAISICGVTCNPWVATTMTPVLPAACDYGATLVTIDPSRTPTSDTTGAIGTGSTTTSIIDATSRCNFAAIMVGMQLRFTSGANNGQKRPITAVTNETTLTVGTAFGNTPALGDTFVIELPSGTATAGAAGTLTDANAAWTVNQYSNCDAVIIQGTGVGQKRRIASNTATVFTLAAAVTGNVNTGNWAVTPDATSVYRIQMSSDFMYYLSGSTGTGFYKIDLATGTSAPTWTTLTAITGTPSGGANVMWPDYMGAFFLVAIRGNATANVYNYNAGLNSWSTPTLRIGSEVFSTGSSSTMWGGHRKIIIQKEGTTRIYALDLSSQELEPFLTMPYAAPSAYDGKRMRIVKTEDGAEWLYIIRAGAAEFFRVPLEWG